MSKGQTRAGPRRVARLAYFLKRLSLDLVGVARAIKGDVTPARGKSANLAAIDGHLFTHHQCQKVTTEFNLPILLDSSDHRISVSPAEPALLHLDLLFFFEIL